MNKILLLLLILNTLSFFLFGLDKYKAIKNKRRISEKALYLSSFFGGIVGANLAMLVFRHKIRKFKFLLIEGFIVLFWLSVLYYGKLFQIFL